MEKFGQCATTAFQKRLNLTKILDKYRYFDGLLRTIGRTNDQTNLNNTGRGQWFGTKVAGAGKANFVYYELNGEGEIRIIDNNMR